jgi:hypothetical protein
MTATAAVASAFALVAFPKIAISAAAAASILPFSALFSVGKTLALALTALRGLIRRRATVVSSLIDGRRSPGWRRVRRGRFISFIAPVLFTTRFRNVMRAMIA